MITDYQLQQFMDALAADQRGKNGLLLSDWEANFVASYNAAGRKSLWFTAGRRLATDRLWRRYGPELNHPHPDDLVAAPRESAAITPADPTGCEYLVKGEDGRQQRCNEPAICREPGRLRYCQAHAEAVRAAMKRSGKTIALINL